MRANTGSQVVSFLNLMSFSDSSNLASGGFLAASPLICNCLELREGHRGWSVAYRKWGTKKKKKRLPGLVDPESFSDSAVKLS